MKSVDSERFDLVRRHFTALKDLPVEKQSDYFAKHCAGDSDLQTEIESLLCQNSKPRKLVRDDIIGRAAGLWLSGDEIDMGKPRLPTRIGKYEIISLLGEGGMGSVFLARQENPKRLVALKVIREGLHSDELVRRFRFEATALGRLQHPGIAQIHDAGMAEAETEDKETQTRLFLAMEYVDGKPLTQYAEDVHLDIKSRLELVASIADAVEHAHAKGIIHRDLKPGNILVDREGSAKVLDFGVARASDSDVMTVTMHTSVGQLVGTLGYMSPEQVNGLPDKIDTRCDVYSLGVILYELLSGFLPINIEKLSVPQAARMIQDHEPSNLGSADSRFRGDIETIVAKALEKEASVRYQAASELALDIRRHLRNDPITARPMSTFYQFKKLVRRHRSLAVGLASTMIVLVIGIIVAMSLANQSKNFANQSKKNEDDAVAQKTIARRTTYMSMLRSASVSFANNNQMRVKEDLGQAPIEFRNWEWRFFNSSVNIRMLDIGRTYHSVSFRENGRAIVAYQDDNIVGIIDVETGTEEFSKTFEDAQVRYVLSTDGTTLITASGPFSEFLLWDIEKQQLSKRIKIPEPRPSRVGDFRFTLSRDGSLLAYDHNGELRVLEVETGETRFHVSMGQLHYSEFSPDGNMILSYEANRHNDKSRKFFWTVRNTDDGQSILKNQHRPLNTQFNAAWRNDSKSIAVTQLNGGAIELLYVSPSLGRQSFGAELRLKSQASVGLVFLQGSMLATAEADGEVKIWNTESEKLTKTFVLPIRYLSLIANHDGTALGVKSHDWFQTIDLKYGQGLSFKGHQDYVLQGVFSPNGQLIASGGWDHTIRIWDALTGEILVTYPTGTLVHKSNDFHQVKALCFSADGTELLVWAGGGSRWQLATGKRLEKGIGKPDGSSDFPDTQESRGFIARLGNHAQIFGGRISANGRFAAYLDKNEARIVDRQTNTETFLSQSRYHFAALAFRHDDKIIATASSTDGVVRLWDLETGEAIRSIATRKSEILSLCFSKDGTRIFAGYRNGEIGVIDPEHGDVITELVGHRAYVHALQMSPDGTRLLSASGDHDLRIWDTKTPFERRDEAHEALKLREELKPRIDRLLAKLGDGAKVLAEIRGDKSLSKRYHQAALHLLIQRN